MVLSMKCIEIGNNELQRIDLRRDSIKFCQVRISKTPKGNLSGHKLFQDSLRLTGINEKSIRDLL